VRREQGHAVPGDKELQFPPFRKRDGLRTLDGLSPERSVMSNCRTNAELRGLPSLIAVSRSSSGSARHICRGNRRFVSPEKSLCSLR
jgi:hypothetical protein